MRAVRASNVAIHTTSHDSSCTLQALQGAMVLAAGVELDAKCFDTAGGRSMEGIPKFLRLGINDDARQQTMEAAHQFSDMSALDILAEAVRLDGNVAPRSRKALIKAAFSGSALDSVFTSSVSASLGGWVSEVDVPDFKSNERELLAKGPDLDLLPRGQTAQHLSRSDVEESYKVHRYAKQFVVDEQDIIDDRLGALRQTPAEMGQAAARVRPDLVYSILFANANLADGTALFVAGHSNLQTSSGLSSATLRAAIESIMTQQDNSVNLNLRASHLIVPAGLVHTAWELVNSSQLLTTGTTDAVQGSSNPLTVHNLSVVADARLDNGVTDPLSGTVHAGSATTWYMAAAMGHTIEVGYIRGMGRSPSVRSEVLTGGTWGLSWDIKLDVGAKALDFRSLNQATA